MILWVIGAGGLFGSAVVRAAQARRWTLFQGSSIPWSDPKNAVEVITKDAHRLADTLQLGQRWAIVWAAGRTTTTSTQEEATNELSVFRQSLAAIRAQLGSHSNGVFLLASSAGGVYAGSRRPPFDATTTPHPTGVYGNLKRNQEVAVQRTLNGSVKVIIARIANLYGPGQDLNKLQGLISRLALAAITKQTLTMFVPLDTLRDYIEVNDAADVALHWLAESTDNYRVRVIATGDAVSLGHIISEMKVVTHSQIPVAHGIHPSAAAQASDLRLSPDSDEKVILTPLTKLPVGMKAVFEDVLLRHQRGATPGA